MSTFKVSVETLDRVWKHPGADLLELASVAGMSFQFVVLKDKHKAGDTVLYFPIDSLMPPELIETLGLTGRLAGKEQNRLKTIKLRKAISQGLVSFPKDLSLTVEEAQTRHLSLPRMLSLSACLRMLGFMTLKVLTGSAAFWKRS
jgi:RNA ligase (TIGR02306 family)